MDTATRYRLCVEGLQSFVKQAGFSHVVLGLSGGIDSALVAVMCVDALGSDHVHAVLLPGPYSSTHSLVDAQALAENLQIASQVISITKPFDAFASVLGDACKGGLQGLAAENTQARCRMVVLMALSNTYGWMLVNTGNKSEALMGYSTLYGDAAGAFAPLGQLYKTEVYAASRWRNDQALQKGNRMPIPSGILTKPPSAELAPNQEDEKSLGISYETLDKILRAVVDQGKDVKTLIGDGFLEADIDRVMSRIQASAFKRALVPPSPQGIEPF